MRLSTIFLFIIKLKLRIAEHVNEEWPFNIAAAVEWEYLISCWKSIEEALIS